MTNQNKSLLTGINAEYIAHLYTQYLRDAGSVNPSWQNFFQDLSDDELVLIKEMHGASWTPAENRQETRSFAAEETANVAVAATGGRQANVTYLQPRAQVTDTAPHPSAVRDALKSELAARAIRTYGHYRATLDPLGRMQPSGHPDLPAKGSNPELEAIYCAKTGYEFMHIANAEERNWLQAKIEQSFVPTAAQKTEILENLSKAEGLELYLSKKYVGVKRFGLEGGESSLVAVEEILHHGSQLGVKHAIIGMAHRGRLNVLTNVCGKPFTKLFAEFNGVQGTPEGTPGLGDVKYHMGYSTDRDMRGGQVHVSLAFNPSHLEFVNPVVMGRVRATQVLYNDDTGAQVLPILIHGDAAFAGQGVVPESLMLSQLPGYKVGGTLHLIINNQVGFTTSPQYSRSGPYSSDIAKMIDAPIFHVNGDCPESVLKVSRLAMAYRQTFKKDVVIDLVCYRRNGHNESDEPAFTQPTMYHTISNQKSTRTLYAEKLNADGVLDVAKTDAIADAFKTRLDADFEAAKSYKPNKADMLEGNWTGFVQSIDETAPRSVDSGIDADTFTKVMQALVTIPSEVSVNPKIMRQLETKKSMADGSAPFDWGTAEALAFGALLDQGYAVRLSGQDVGRGTFSHRHACLTCQNTDKRYYPLQHVAPHQAPFFAYDSPLSETAVMAYDYGYSLADPRSLVLWEGQFGDFANGAQVIIDQFISSAETKWLRMSGLVLLLPHGYEGQGPEHSSARLERFLQLSAEDNWSVVNCSTPASYFHVLRRQMMRNFRKPLVSITPKSLLRHKLCVSTKADFAVGTQFQPVLVDAVQNPKDVKRVVICSGKVYYDLLESLLAKPDASVAIIRLEQLYPFPEAELAKALAQFPKAENVIWAQEEPENQGAWSFVDRRIEKALGVAKHKCSRPVFVGRAAAASPATGYAKQHLAEQAKLVEQALRGV